MASTAELRPSEPGEHGGDLLRSSAVPGVPEGVHGAAGGRPVAPEGLRSHEALGGHLSVAHEALWKAAEPARGQMVRARYRGHHTAGLVFTRDDREGHPAGFSYEADQNWWSHEQSKWMSWQAVGAYLSERKEAFVVEVLVRPSRGIAHRLCEPDGACEVEEQDSVQWL